MGYIIGIAFLLVTFFIVGTVMRKGIYNEVDQLGQWKIDILNRPISNEIARVKHLNMSGETEQKFEEWRSEWEQIVTMKLPELEEQLFEAEEASEKYRFRKSKKRLAFIHEQLESVEERIKHMLEEVDAWVTSDEENQTEFALLMEDLRKERQNFRTRYTSLGKATNFLEQAFQEIESSVVKYEEATNNGDYGQARQLILDAREQLDETQEKIAKIPDWRATLKTQIPRNLNEVELGIAEMEKQGYILEHFSPQDEISALRKQAEEELRNIERDQLADTPQTITHIHDRIDEIYVLLEKEVQARATIIEERKQIEADLAHVEEAVAALKKEAEIVSLSYRIDDVDLKTKLTLGNKVEKLNARFMLVEEEIDKQEQSYSILLEALSEIKESVTQLKKLNEESMAMLKKLRKDELEAQEKIATLKQQLFHARRLIQRHNLPGLSDEYLILFDEASEHLYDVEEQLSKKPLDIPAMNYALEKAIEVCEKCLLTIEELVETALLSEKVIQYGNRFRSQYPFVEKALIEAEAAFRRYDYEGSLEIAGRALQKVDSETFKQLNVEIEKIESSVSVH